MKRLNRKNRPQINSKISFIVFFITMFLFSTSYAFLNQELTLTGTVSIYTEDEGTDLTITNFNERVDSVVIDRFLFFVTNAYRVVGITIQNPLHRSVNNWTIEFQSTKTPALTRPTDNELSAYLNAENAYSDISYSNNTVTVKGNDTLAPGESKTIYVFFHYTLTDSFNFNGNRRAYYTPGTRSALMAKRANDSELIIKTIDKGQSNDAIIHASYYTEPLGGNLYNTTMYIVVGNNSGTTISDLQFDVSYRDTNLAKLSSNDIEILSNTESGASFLTHDVIENQSGKAYFVSGIKTYGGFKGMDISNISYSTGGGTANTQASEPTPTIIETPVPETTNIEPEPQIENTISNTIIESTTNTVTDEVENQIDNTILSEENENIITNEIIENENTIDEGI